ncbi:hypothetical protein [Cryobacterium fucosi]|uniref:Uncharacterized protein n=1 Tax=Cryobacterium fucosi TaxID=1259157 RepID=A0A4R9B5B6_9MICO|nr:hypothetical protein [Cryobacterium fucosi]TFD76060.1 hypothetical protein E3T48_10825 [Cryobacterium fucosi]
MSSFVALRRAIPACRNTAQSPRSRRDPISDRERVAAAQARVAADRLRGVTTEQWIVDLAKAVG